MAVTKKRSMKVRKTKTLKKRSMKKGGGNKERTKPKKTKSKAPTHVELFRKSVPKPSILGYLKGNFDETKRQRENYEKIEKKFRNLNKSKKNSNVIKRLNPNYDITSSPYYKQTQTLLPTLNSTIVNKPKSVAALEELRSRLSKTSLQKSTSYVPTNIRGPEEQLVLNTVKKPSRFNLGYLFNPKTRSETNDNRFNYENLLLKAHGVNDRRIPPPLAKTTSEKFANAYDAPERARVDISLKNTNEIIQIKKQMEELKEKLPQKEKKGKKQVSVPVPVPVPVPVTGPYISPVNKPVFSIDNPYGNDLNPHGNNSQTNNVPTKPVTTKPVTTNPVQTNSVQKNKQQIKLFPRQTIFLPGLYGNSVDEDELNGVENLSDFEVTNPINYGGTEL